MVPRRSLAVGAWCLAAALAVEAAPTLSTEYRYASQVSEWFVRGDAAVSQSTAFTRGIRLAAWDSQNEEEASRVAVASAVYFFQAPAEARSVTIEVGYKPDPAAQNREIGGFLFVRNQAVEQQYAQHNQAENPENAEEQPNRAADEPTFHGNTYFLPANQVRQTITLPAADNVINGVLEVHLSAGAGQILDVQYVQVATLGAEMPVRIEYAPSADYVPDPYQYTYYYYYAGPCYYPRDGYYAGFTCFDNSLDPFFWGGWTTYRACFYTHHRWVHRPAHYIHWGPIVIHRPVFIININISQHRRHWYRDHFGLDAARATDDDIHRTVRRPPALLVGRDAAREYQQRARLVSDSIRESDRELRAQMGDRFQERIRQWRTDPAQARRELQLSERSQVIQRASAEIRTIRTPRRPADDRPMLKPGPVQPVAPRRTDNPEPPRTPDRPEHRTTVKPRPTIVQPPVVLPEPPKPAERIRRDEPAPIRRNTKETQPTPPPQPPTIEKPAPRPEFPKPIERPAPKPESSTPVERSRRDRSESPAPRHTEEKPGRVVAQPPPTPVQPLIQRVEPLRTIEQPAPKPELPKPVERPRRDPSDSPAPRRSEDQPTRFVPPPQPKPVQPLIQRVEPMRTIERPIPKAPERPAIVQPQPQPQPQPLPAIRPRPVERAPEPVQPAREVRERVERSRSSESSSQPARVVAPPPPQPVQPPPPQPRPLPQVQPRPVERPAEPVQPVREVRERVERPRSSESSSQPTRVTPPPPPAPQPQPTAPSVRSESSNPASTPPTAPSPRSRGSDEAASSDSRSSSSSERSGRKGR